MLSRLYLFSLISVCMARMRSALNFSSVGVLSRVMMTIYEVEGGVGGTPFALFFGGGEFAHLKEF